MQQQQNSRLGGHRPDKMQNKNSAAKRVFDCPALAALIYEFDPTFRTIFKSKVCSDIRSAAFFIFCVPLSCKLVNHFLSFHRKEDRMQKTYFWPPNLLQIKHSKARNMCYDIHFMYDSVFYEGTIYLRFSRTNSRYLYCNLYMHRARWRCNIYLMSFYSCWLPLSIFQDKYIAKMKIKYF